MATLQDKSANNPDEAIEILDRDKNRYVTVLPKLEQAFVPKTDKKIKVNRMSSLSIDTNSKRQRFKKENFLNKQEMEKVDDDRN